MSKQKKVLLMTATGSYNLGDELILQEEYHFLKKHYKGTASFRIFTHDKRSSFLKEKDIDYITYFPHNIRGNPIPNIGYLIKNIWLILRADILIVGGGGIIFDNEAGVSFSSLLAQWFFRTKIARLNYTTIIYLGISLEIKQIKNKMQLKKIFRKGDRIIVRDEQSASLLDALEIPCSQIPDLVFLYQPEKVEKLPEKKRIGISVRGGFLSSEDEKQIPLIYEYLEKEGYDPVFLLHTTFGNDTQNDLLFIKRIMKGKAYHTTETIEGTLKVYPTLYAIIGMRFHSLVLASVHMIPFLSISYGPKTKELLNILEVPDEFRLSPEHCYLPVLKIRLQKLIDQYDTEKSRIEKRQKEIHDELQLKLKTL